MFSGGNRHTSPTYYVEGEFSLRPYNTKLGQVAENICTQVGQGG